MIVFDAPVSPPDQTTFARLVPLPPTLVLSRLFPTVTVPNNKVSFSEITKLNRTARFRAPDGRIHVADRDGWSDKSVNMVPLSDSRNRGEYETLLLEMARLGGTNNTAKIDAIYNDTADLTRYVRNRVDLALGDVLVDGKFTPPELGGAEVDYGVPAGNIYTLGTLWSAQATADPITDLVAACDTYERVNGSRPGFVATSTRMRRAFQLAAKTINAVRGAQTGVTRVALNDAFPIFDSEGIPTRWETVETQLDVDGVSTRVLPDDRIILGPSDPTELLEFRMGVTATAMELVNSNAVDFSFTDAPGIVGVTVKEGPPFREFTFVDAIGLPVLKDAKKLMVIKAL